VKPLSVVVAALGAIIAFAGIVGVLAPSVPLGVGRSLLTPTALYIIAAVRIVFGTLLLWVAPESRMPKTVRAIGFIIVVAGLLTTVFGVERSEAVFNWWSSQDPLFVRAFFALPIVVGVFLVDVLSRGRRFVA
jgi:uncharacterized membrane protein